MYCSRFYVDSWQKLISLSTNVKHVVGSGNTDICRKFKRISLYDMMWIHQPMTRACHKQNLVDISSTATASEDGLPSVFRHALKMLISKWKLWFIYALILSDKRYRPLPKRNTSKINDIVLTSYSLHFDTKQSVFHGAIWKRLTCLKRRHRPATASTLAIATAVVWKFESPPRRCSHYHTHRV